jgi:hypothetical protein
MRTTVRTVLGVLVTVGATACAGSAEDSNRGEYSGEREVSQLTQATKRYSDIEVWRCGVAENAASSRLLLGRGGLGNPVWTVNASLTGNGLYRATLPSENLENAIELAGKMCEEAPCLAVEYLLDGCQSGAAGAYPLLRVPCLIAGTLKGPCEAQHITTPARVCALVSQFTAAVLDGPVRVAATASIPSIGMPGTPPLSVTSSTIAARWSQLPDFVGASKLVLPCQCDAGKVPCGGRCVDLQTDVNNCGACGRVCSSGEQCTGGLCICTPVPPSQACASGQTCGTAPDGCGGTVSCGSCTAPETCGGGGVANQCGATSCASDWELVPRSALALESGAGGSGLQGSYDDGTVVMGEGPIWFGPHESGFVPSWYPADRLADASAPALWQTIWGIGSETMSGYILGARSGTVDLGVWCDDYCSIDIPGKLSVVGDDTGSAVGSAQLEAGIWYPITIGYANRWGSNGVGFYRRCP